MIVSDIIVSSVKPKTHTFLLDKYYTFLINFCWCILKNFVQQTPDLPVQMMVMIWLIIIINEKNVRLYLEFIQAKLVTPTNIIHILDGSFYYI